MKKVLRAFDNKDVSSLTAMVSRREIDPNKIIPDKGVALFHLIIGHQSENFALTVAKLFLRYGGDPNVPSEDGVTPTHVAAAWGRTRILHLLLVNGGDPWLQDDDRKNAFNYAFEEQEWDAVEMLHHFQQMHSSASCKRDIEETPKFVRNFERILMRKGVEMFEYSIPNDKSLKSTKTQTPQSVIDEMSCTCPSPILSKIKYFESRPPTLDIGWRKPEKSAIEESKDLFHTSCEVVINSESKQENETSKLANETEKHEQLFVSSVNIDTSLKTEELNRDSVIVLEKTSNQSFQKSEDVRSQLFLELQEAVLRRSMLKVDEKQEKKPKIIESESSKNVSTHFISDLSISTSDANISSEIKDRHVPDDPFLTKEVSYLYGVNLSNNSLLRHMSDFATKVMNEIELSVGDNDSRKSNGQSNSNAEFESTYITCNEGLSFDNDKSETMKSVAPIENNPNYSMTENSNESFLSVAEEYKYTDEEEGVILLEKKLLVSPSVSELHDSEVDAADEGSSIISEVSSIPSSISYASDVLRSELTSYGYVPGPICKTTKRLYLRKLWRLRQLPIKLSNCPKREYSNVLEKSLKSESNLENVLSYSKLEDEMMYTFDNFPHRKWREGSSKTSFNYLLLDPRISLNLPRRAVTMPDLEIWKCFLSSVFYIGKGKRVRPYAHLYEAASLWNKKREENGANEKIQCILDIWSDDQGVICLQVFQNVIPVEAYTREAAMIDAFGVSNLKNVKCGEYYGAAATWKNKEKLQLGVYLLYKAMLIFLNEGERQIRPHDIT